jgi:hypothetical protein
MIQQSEEPSQAPRILEQEAQQDQNDSQGKI